ncbi:transposase [Dactylosporangium sp. CA-233914]|uniref:transposase n=1 Tax=Dactylosporangium sp. CA-233914 TaxID=3239934 RepID=UPI003D93669A
MSRQYSGTLRRTGNCQIAVSVQLATDTASVASVLPGVVGRHHDQRSGQGCYRPSATGPGRDRQRRAALGEVGLALDMLDEMIGQWRQPNLPVFADSADGA